LFYNSEILPGSVSEPGRTFMDGGEMISRKIGAGLAELRDLLEQAGGARRLSFSGSQIARLRKALGLTRIKRKGGKDVRELNKMMAEYRLIGVNSFVAAILTADDFDFLPVQKTNTRILFRNSCGDRVNCWLERGAADEAGVEDRPAFDDQIELWDDDHR